MTTIRRTERWRGVISVALATTAVGVVATRPLVILAGVVGVVFGLYPRLATPPGPELAIERSLDDVSPAPGETVEVTVTVTNEGEQTLPDVRIVDGVPPMLYPVAGTARHAAVLRPGSATTFSYTLEAGYGVHRFEPATIIARDLSGATEVETDVTAKTELTCSGSAPTVPLRPLTQPFPGTIPTNSGGSGTEFHGVRAYRPGDPMGQIDWNQFARSGDLATIEYRRENITSVVLCVDARAPAYVGPENEPHAVSYCVTAAEQLLTALIDARERVGLAAFGRDICWYPPGTGTEHERRAKRLLATHRAFSLHPGEPMDEENADDQLDTLRARLGGDTQVFLLSPLADAFAVRAATTLEVEGHDVTAIVPDVTSMETPGQQLAAIERENRVARLRGSSVRVIDWDPDESLGAVMAIADERARVMP